MKVASLSEPKISLADWWFRLSVRGADSDEVVLTG
jgi:hypothetical protein